MDNFNALSKSAILTKLALDGYFIDLLTLNTFIKDWQIEAIYENEFGIEFFDNNSYLTILNNLKDKYSKAKAGIEEPKPKIEQAEIQETKEPLKAASNIAENTHSLDENTDEKDAEIVLDEIVIEDNNIQKEPEISSVPVLETNLPQTEDFHLIKEENEMPAPKYQDKTDIENNTGGFDSTAVSLEELAVESKKEIQNEDIKIQCGQDNKADTITPEIIEHYEDAILPMAMRNLKPGPVTPTSNINIDHSYDETVEVLHYENNEETVHIIDDNGLDSFEQESFSADEIEKANNLISNANKTAAQKLPESITETYFDTSKPSEKTEPATAQESGTAEHKEAQEAKTDELDLVQLAQSFAQNFTGKETGDVPPADLEQIFTESYTEPFSELQDYVKDGPEEYKSLQEDLPSDIIPEVPKAATHSDRALVSSHSGSDLSAEDVRNIIREEIARQTASIVPVPQNNENVKEILREIVKQTADVVPQNAFKLDISQGTLDMIAKTIAKKIAIKLNSYYKLNSSKQNAKLQLFRTRTIELKEKNQMLADENRRLKARLHESNSELNSYKRTIFGLYKFEGRKRR